MPQYLYRIRPARLGFFEAPTAAEQAAVAAHFAYLERLALEDVVLLAGRTLNDDAAAFGIVVLEAVSLDDAQDLMMRDPAVELGVFIAELFPYRIALASPRLLETAPPLRNSGSA